MSDDENNPRLLIFLSEDKKGFWEIDPVKKSAYYRITRFRNPIKDYNATTNISTDYETIQDYLLLEQNFDYFKEIIPSRKVLFSNGLFCDVKGCEKNAFVYSNGVPTCKEHYTKSS